MIAQRHTIKNYADDKLEEFIKLYDSSINEHGVNPLRIVEDTNSAQPSGAKRFSGSTAEIRQSSKKAKRYPEIPQELYAKLFGNAGSSKHHSKTTDVLNPGTPHHLLPVLAICAPNVDQVNSYNQVNSYKNSICGSMKEQKRASGEVANKPLSTPGADHSSEQKNDGQSAPSKPMFPGSSEETLRRLNNIIPDSYFPFHPIPPISGKGPCHPVENPGSSIASFQGKLGLPNFSLEDNIALKHMKLVPDLFPNLSLGTNKEYVRNSVPELPNSLLLPNFMTDIAGTSKQKHKFIADMSGLLPGLGISPVQSIHLALPENHKKVLDNIIMRAQYATNKFLKKRSKPDYWSEDELYALWIGVRRHGRGNWDAMLRDPKLKFLNHRTNEELASRWILEEQKIIEEPMSTATRSSNSTLLPGISDEMMSRALNGSNFSKLRMEPLKLQSHLTGIQLGCSDIPSRFPHVEPANYMNSSEGGPSLTPLLDFKHRSGYGGDFPGSTFDKREIPDVGLVPPFMQNPFMKESIGSLPMNRQNSSSIQHNSSSIQHNVVGSSSHENILLHGVSDGQVNLFNEMQRLVKLGKQPIEMNLNHTKHTNPLLENSGDIGGSKSNKLPHWLQEAVRAPSKPPECELPATVSAIAQSVCLLLGEQKPSIPPFLIPGCRLSRPKDPRSAPKKRRVHKVQQASSQTEHSKIRFGQGEHSSTPSAPPFMEASSTSPAVDHNNGAPSLNLNSPSSCSAGSQGQDGLPPSAFEESHKIMEGSEAIAATCTPRSEAPGPGCQRTEDMASGSCRSPVRDTPDSGALRSELFGSSVFRSRNRVPHPKDIPNRRNVFDDERLEKVWWNRVQKIDELKDSTRVFFTFARTSINKALEQIITVGEYH